MKIVSINAASTKSAHQVAFNVDSPPTPGVMEKISYGKLSIRFEDGLLHVSAKDGPAISKTVVTALSGTITEAEQLVAKEAADQTRKHALIVDAVSKATGLAIQ